ncbi:MAG: hypothetical protein HKN44_09040, partial [Ilumatobacter sp.]|nr:hypothetical protein [Ilumatobacter sp.]
MVAIVERCPARAAIAGNPSDGFGGAVLAIPVRTRHAEVTIRPSTRFAVADADGTTEYADADELIVAARTARAGDIHSLVLGAIAVSERAAPGRGDPEPFTVAVSTTIPRSVGLAGSSAIVLATLRALARHSDRPATPPDALAPLALHVERDLLGIAAGLQDRVVQAYDRPMMMRFGADDVRFVGGFEGGRYEPLPDQSGLDLFVAFQPHDPTPSQVVHADLRTRFDRGDPAVRAAMSALGDEAERANTAWVDGDVDALGSAMDRSFDLRRSVLDLDPRHVEMVDVVRRAGAHANYSGSGGAITVLCADPAAGPDAGRAARTAVAAIGCELIER